MLLVVYGIFLLLAILSVFQIALASGAPLGKFAWGGQHAGKLPTRFRIGSAVSVSFYVLIAYLVASRTAIIDSPLSPQLVAIWLWIIVGLLGLSTLANLASPSRQEKRIMAPIAAMLTALVVIVNLFSS